MVSSRIFSYQIGNHQIPDLEICGFNSMEIMSHVRHASLAGDVTELCYGQSSVSGEIFYRVISIKLMIIVDNGRRGNWHQLDDIAYGSRRQMTMRNFQVLTESSSLFTKAMIPSKITTLAP